MKELLSVVKKFHLHNKRYAIIAYIFGIIDIIFTSIMSLMMKYLLDTAVNTEDTIIKVIIFMLLGIVIAKGCDILRRYLIAIFSSRTVAESRQKCFKHLQELSLQDLSNIQASYLIGRFSTDMSAIQNLTSVIIPSSITGGIKIITNITLIFILDVRLALISIVALLLSVLVLLLLERKSRNAIKDLKDQSGILTNMLIEDVNNQSSIKAFDLQDITQTKYDSENEKLKNLSFKSMFINGWMTVASNGLIEVFSILIICFGAFLVYSNSMTVGTLVSFNSLFSALSAAVFALIAIIPSIIECKVCMHNLELFFNKKSSIINESNEDLPESIDKISLNNITFGYNSEKPILNDISLIIPTGKSIAIVGRSGSGKSTIANLLMRFYDPDSGTIMINDRDYKQLNLHSLHDNIGIVSQDTVLFNTSITDNIKIAKPDATFDEIVEAAKSASADFILNLPNSFAYQIKNGGKSLSSGQRQRISLARTLLRKPRFLIIDEVTASLDPITEQAINNVIAKLIEQGTTIINITHRLSTIYKYNYIYVLSEGSVAESGTHLSLINNNGIYAKLFEKQSGFMVTNDLSSATITPERLAKIDLFNEFPTEFLTEVCKKFNSITYSDSSTIITEGDEGDLFYIIVRGQVKILKRINDNNVQVATLEDGDFFGEIALLSNVPRTATVCTISPTLLIYLKRSVFIELIDSMPNLRNKIQNIIDIRLSELNALSAKPTDKP